MWNQRESPLRVEKRFDFEEYSRISKFMKMVDELCGKVDGNSYKRIAEAIINNKKAINI